MDLVFDTVGGETLDRSWGVLKPVGRLVTIASGGAARDERAKGAFFIVEPRREQLVRGTAGRLAIRRCLDAVQLGVLAALGHEGLVGADFRHACAVEYDDEVGHAYGAEAV